LTRSPRNPTARCCVSSFPEAALTLTSGLMYASVTWAQPVDLHVLDSSTLPAA